MNIKFWVLTPFLILSFIIIYLEVILIYIIWPRPDIFAIVHHILMIIFLYVMHRTAYVSPGHPDPTALNADPYAQLRSCKYCQVFKPPRCHHCRQCNKCILRMDHHCPWINNCIGKNNYKYFISMVTISTIMSLCYSIGMFRRVLNYDFGQYDSSGQYYNRNNVNDIFGLSYYVSIFKIKISIFQRFIVTNKTTLEFFEHKRTRYDKGCWKNTQEMLS